VLKDAGCAPAEVQLLNDAAQIRKRLRELPAGSPEAGPLRLKLVELEATIALRLDRIARSRSL
jgi:hypothetical protein